MILDQKSTNFAISEFFAVVQTDETRGDERRARLRCSTSDQKFEKSIKTKTN